MSRATWLKALLVAALILVGSEASASASPGDLDRSFGVNGISSPALGDGELARDSAVQDDGRIVVVGSTYPVGTGLIMRLLPDGSLDQSFGQSGVVRLPGRFFDGVAVAEDGGIVAAGRAGEEVTIVRILADGTPDPDFADDGIFQMAADWQESGPRAVPLKPHITALEILTDGRIMAGGAPYRCTGYTETGWCRPVLTVRLMPDGQPDPDFGDGSGLNIQWPIEEFGAVGFRPGGQTVTASTGEYETADGYSSYTIIEQFPADGGWSYDDPERWTIDLYGSGRYGGSASPHGSTGTIISNDEDDTVYIASGTLVAKVSVQGKLDTSLGLRGYVSIRPSDLQANLGSAMEATDIELDRAGRLMVSGCIYSRHAEGAFLARLEPDGSADPTFSNDGVATVSRPGNRPLPDVGFNPPVTFAAVGGGFALARTSVDAGGKPTVAVAKILGGEGRQTFCAGKPATYIGDGRDETIVGHGGVVDAGPGNDVVSWASLVCAGPGDDRVEAAASTAFGEAGDDVFFGLGPYRGRPRSTSETLIGGPGNDVMKGFAGNDRLFGSAGNDRAYGGRGNDRIFGGSGNDLLRGMAGIDFVSGGPGRDDVDGGPTHRPASVYLGSGPDCRVRFVTRHGFVRNVVMSTPRTCAGADGATKGAFHRFRLWEPFAFRNRTARYWSPVDEGWGTQSFVVRRRGKRAFGFYVYRRESGRYRACWTGNGPRQEAKVPFRATLQPPLRQVVRP